MVTRSDWTAASEGDCVVYEHISGWEVWWRCATVNTNRYIAIGPGELAKPLDAIGVRFATLKSALNYCEEQAKKGSNQPPST